MRSGGVSYVNGEFVLGRNFEATVFVTDIDEEEVGGAAGKGFESSAVGSTDTDAAGMHSNRATDDVVTVEGGEPRTFPAADAGPVMGDVKMMNPELQISCEYGSATDVQVDPAVRTASCPSDPSIGDKLETRTEFVVAAGDAGAGNPKKRCRDAS
jgi:hypothetical protein